MGTLKRLPLPNCVFLMLNSLKIEFVVLMKFDVLNFEQIHKFEVGSLGLKSQRPPTKPRHVVVESKPAPRKIFLPKPKGVSLHTFVKLFLP